MKNTIVNIIGTESTQYLMDLLRDRTKKSTITVRNFANQVQGVNAVKCRKLLRYLSTIGYGKFISSNEKKDIKYPKVNSNFEWSVIPSEFVKEFERPREFSSDLVKEFERPREFSSDLVKVERKQIVTIEEFSYKTTAQQSTTKAQKAGQKN